MKKYVYYIGAFTALIIVLVWWQLSPSLNKDMAVIKYFPLNKKAEFLKSDTSLTMQEPVKNKEQYKVNWTTESIINQKSFLRQDFSLLFQNGKLVDSLKGWKENTNKILQQKMIEAHESSLFETVTMHYAEIHLNDGTPTSSYKITGAQLFVISSRYGPIKSFQMPESKEQKDWAFTLSSVTSSRLTKVLNRYIEKENIDITDYTVVPLTQINSKEDELMKEYLPEKQTQIIEKLWEGLYSTYVLGIKKEDGTVIDAKDSTIPLILRKLNSKNLIILIQDKNGTIHTLMQRLP